MTVEPYRSACTIVLTMDNDSKPPPAKPPVKPTAGGI
jgi:hypothetical protein